MENKVVEFSNRSGKKVFSFVGFDSCENYTDIIRIVQEKIKPENINYSGFEDIIGYFEKDQIHIDIIYDEMIGNFCEYEENKYNEIQKREVHNWMDQIYWELNQKDKTTNPGYKAF